MHFLAIASAILATFLPETQALNIVETVEKMDMLNAKVSTSVTPIIPGQGFQLCIPGCLPVELTCLPPILVCIDFCEDEGGWEWEWKFLEKKKEANANFLGC